jgi:hemolysin III
MYHGEKLNSITHLAGTALSLVGLGALLTVAIQHRDPWMIASFTIFGLALVLLYSMSTLYHSFSPPRLKKIFQKLDHVSIYLLIAGSYTPYTLVTLRDGKGPMMLAVVWSLAIIGIALDVFSKRRIEVLQVIIYLAMGWVCVLDFSSLKAALPLPGIIWLIAGGLD